MVVGKGMLANAFINAEINNEDLIIFASGVSNSLETDPLKFKREISLLQNYVASPSRLVYFSTVSVFDPSLAKSPYRLHKQRVEKTITAHFKRFIIIRLPIVVGPSSNPHTLTNFLYTSITQGKKFDLFKNATRYLIDLDDVVKLTSILIQNTSLNCQVNLVFDNKETIESIVQAFSVLTGINPNYNLLPKGSDYQVDNSLAMKLIGNKYFHINKEEYLQNLLRKYYHP